jgi:hypothetical protein
MTYREIPNDFDDWVDYYGGLEELFIVFGTRPEDLYLEDYETSLAMAAEELEDRFNNLISQYFNLEYPIILYRAICTKTPKGIRRDDVGIYWSLDFEKADCYWAPPPPHNKYVLECEVDENDIDWETTLLNNMRPITGEEEEEITLKEGAKIHITGFWENPDEEGVEVDAMAVAGIGRGE